MSLLSLEEAFAPLNDPRQAVKVEYPLIEILAIALCETISGAHGYTEIAEMAQEREEWYRTSLGLPLSNGIPSHDTFGNVFRMLDTATFHQCFLRWMSAADIVLEGTTVSLDGKTLRRSHHRGKGIKALHMVSAFASDYGLVLGQRCTEEKSNEITAIPELLGMLYLKGCIVTIDAMGTQTEIVETIREKEADYLLPVKANQPMLQQDVVECFNKAERKQWRGIEHTAHRTIDGGHGRVETRTCWAMPLPKAMAEQAERWKDLRSIAMIEAVREINGQSAIERRYYITSLPAEASVILGAARAHWGIENQLHWRLDVQMNEDQCRVRGNGGENLAVIRHIALNQLRRENSTKKSLRIKQRKAARNDDYLEKVLFAL
jgi:predicted transposase YbfD/YdcC